jgi:hypothetical protein
MIVGHFAMWAVRQSPYEQPADLSQGIMEFAQNLGMTGVDAGDYFTCDSLKTKIETAIAKSLTVVGWNKPKIGDHKMGFVDRYNQPKPDCDFIDLDALARNISHSVWLEILYNDEVAVINIPTEVIDESTT